MPRDPLRWVAGRAQVGRLPAGFLRQELQRKFVSSPPTRQAHRALVAATGVKNSLVEVKSYPLYGMRFLIEETIHDEYNGPVW